MSDRGPVTAPAGRLTGLDREIFDAIIVGGGMAGAGVAPDQAPPGRTGIHVEKGDIAGRPRRSSSTAVSGTSSSSTSGSSASPSVSGRRWRGWRRI